MKFYRKVTCEDLSNQEAHYKDILSDKTRELIKIDSKLLGEAAKSMRNETYCSLQDAVKLAKEYQSWLKVLDDYKNGAEIYTEY